MAAMEYSALRERLLDRKQLLEKAVSQYEAPTNIISLLQEVDQALERMNRGSYGICDVCHEGIEPERLYADPLIKVCLDHLNHTEKKMLESDLEISAKVQRALLPKKDLKLNGWLMSYHYQSSGAVSGDYCDLISQENDDEFFFFLGDVSGKGIPAAMLMSNLHALFRSLTRFNLPVNTLLAEANRLFCQSTISSYYATLVCGKATNAGSLEIANAGHCNPILIREGKPAILKRTGLPMGLFCGGEFKSEKTLFNSGDCLIIYSDGLSEAFFKDEQYGEERIIQIAEKNQNLPPGELINVYLNDLAKFKKDFPQNDDLTIMILKKV
jgi:phosphoserine phosphatase RsbU/P